jgi:hypothetical protein
MLEGQCWFAGIGEAIEQVDRAFLQVQVRINIENNYLAFLRD